LWRIMFNYLWTNFLFDNRFLSLIKCSLSCLA
jgi:hypothetical protein